jgi:hypothetical protein
MTGSHKRVAVVVPLHDREHLTPDEQVSLRHLRHYLGRYDRYVIAPEGLPLPLFDFRLKRYPRKYFGSAQANKKLFLSRRLYRDFAEYEYILIYHLDALVFSDELEEWCRAGFDYIGAPWFESEDEPERGLSDVGNGGFSLRKVSSCLKVIESRRYKVEPNEYWRHHHASKPWHLRLANLPRRYLKRWTWFNGARWEMARFRYNEDKFWARRARHYYPEFRIAPPDVALRFAFECQPRPCYERNEFRLPFGCHAWARYDRAFWEPFLLSEETASP